jgi:hypothetical protein
MMYDILHAVNVAQLSALMAHTIVFHFKQAASSWKLQAGYIFRSLYVVRLHARMVIEILHQHYTHACKTRVNLQVKAD